MCGKSLEQVGQINMEFDKMQPKRLHELCLKGKSKLEIQAQDLLEHPLNPDSKEKLMLLFAQLPQLDLLLGEMKSQKSSEPGCL